MDVAVQDSTEVDIYADLPNFKYDETLDKLKKSEAQLLYANGKLKILIEEKTREIELLKAKVRNLEVNISSLLKTARLEIGRKDRTIADLRTQINSSRRLSVPASPRTKLSNHRERLKADRSPRKSPSVRRDLSKDDFQQRSDSSRPSDGGNKVAPTKSKEATNAVPQNPPPRAVQPSVPIFTLFSARALQRIRAEEQGQNTEPHVIFPPKDLPPSVESSGVALEPHEKELARLLPEESPPGTEKPKDLPKLPKESENVIARTSPEPPKSTEPSLKSSLEKTTTPSVLVSVSETEVGSCGRVPEAGTTVAPTELLVTASRDADSSRINRVLPPPSTVKAIRKDSSCDRRENGSTDSVQSQKTPKIPHLTGVRNRTRPQINVSPISSAWRQTSKQIFEPNTRPEPPKTLITTTTLFPKPSDTVPGASKPKSPLRTKATIVDLFGSPVKWTENSSDVVPFDISSPAVFEDSVITQSDCADRINLTNCPASAASIKPAGVSKPTSTQPDLREPTFLCSDHTLAEPSATNFESTTQFVSALTKTYTQLSPLKSPRGSNSLPHETSDPQRRHFTNDTLHPESTNQFVTSLERLSPQISPPKSPVLGRESSPRKEKNSTPKVLPCTTVESGEAVGKAESTTVTSSIFNLPSQKSIDIFSKNRTTKRDFSDRPINILQPRKTPRIVGSRTTKPSSSCTIPKASNLSTLSEPSAAKIAISESFLSEQEKRVRHWQKEKLFCHSFSFSDKRSFDVHHTTEVVYSSKAPISSSGKVVETLPVTNDLDVLPKSKPAAPVSTVQPVARNSAEVPKKPVRTTSGEPSIKSPGNAVKSKQTTGATSILPIKPTARTSNFKRSSALKNVLRATDGSGDQRTRFEIIAEARGDLLYKPKPSQNGKKSGFDESFPRNKKIGEPRPRKESPPTRKLGKTIPLQESRFVFKPKESPSTSLPSSNLVVRPRTRFETVAEARRDTLYKPKPSQHSKKGELDESSPRNRKLAEPRPNKESAPTVKLGKTKSPQESRFALEPKESLPSTKLVVRPRKNVQLQSTTPSSTVHITYGNESKCTKSSAPPSSRQPAQAASALKLRPEVSNRSESVPSQTPHRKISPPLHRATPIVPLSLQNGDDPVQQPSTVTPRVKKRKINLSCVTQATPNKVFVYEKDS